MRVLRAIARRAGVSAMTVGLAAAATVAMSSPSHAAADAITVTVRITVNVPVRFPAVGLQGADWRSCHRGFVLGQAKELSVTARKGWPFRVYPSESCYTFLVVPSREIIPEHDGQMFDIALG